MRKIILQKDYDPTETAHQLCEELEQKIGLKLKKNSIDDMGEIHGYVNTSSDGTVEIGLYDNCPLSDEEINSKLNF